MNKKNYIKPNMDVMNISNELILAASPSENLNNSDVIENGGDSGIQTGMKTDTISTDTLPRTNGRKQPLKVHLEQT
jgi:hypothetical protein